MCLPGSEVGKEKGSSPLRLVMGTSKDLEPKSLLWKQIPGPNPRRKDKIRFGQKLVKLLQCCWERNGKRGSVIASYQNLSQNARLAAWCCWDTLRA